MFTEIEHILVDLDFIEFKKVKALQTKLSDFNNIKIEISCRGKEE